MSTTFDDLPNEVLREICLYIRDIDPQAFRSMHATCSRITGICFAIMFQDIESRLDVSSLYKKVWDSGMGKKLLIWGQWVYANPTLGSLTHTWDIDFLFCGHLSRLTPPPPTGVDSDAAYHFRSDYFSLFHMLLSHLPRLHTITLTIDEDGGEVANILQAHQKRGNLPAWKHLKVISQGAELETVIKLLDITTLQRLDLQAKNSIRWSDEVRGSDLAQLQNEDRWGVGNTCNVQVLSLQGVGWMRVLLDVLYHKLSKAQPKLQRLVINEKQTAWEPSTRQAYLGVKRILDQFSSQLLILSINQNAMMVCHPLSPDSKSHMVGLLDLSSSTRLQQLSLPFTTIVGWRGCEHSSEEKLGPSRSARSIGQYMPPRLRKLTFGLSQNHSRNFGDRCLTLAVESVIGKVGDLETLSLTVMGSSITGYSCSPCQIMADPESRAILTDYGNPEILDDLGLTFSMSIPGVITLREDLAIRRLCKTSGVAYVKDDRVGLRVQTKENWVYMTKINERNSELDT